MPRIEEVLTNLGVQDHQPQYDLTARNPYLTLLTHAGVPPRHVVIGHDRAPPEQIR